MPMPEMYLYTARSLQDTGQLACRLAKHAMPGMVITLDGEMGAGKTAFSQAFAKALGVGETVNSPTFTIIKEYMGTELPLYHMDIYRLSEEEADELGLDEYIFGQGVTLIEWAQKIPSLLPEERLALQLSGQGNARDIVITPYGERYKQLCRVLFGDNMTHSDKHFSDQENGKNGVIL